MQAFCTGGMFMVSLMQLVCNTRGDIQKEEQPMLVKPCKDLIAESMLSKVLSIVYLINKQHQERKKDWDNKNFNTWLMASLLIRPLRCHAWDHGFLLHSNALLAITWVPAEERPEIGHRLEATGRECVHTAPSLPQHFHSESLSRWEIRFYGYISANLLNPVTLRQCATHVLVIPWHFH